MRIGIFIDGITMYHGVMDKKFHFGEFKEWIKGKDEVTIAQYFNSVDNTEAKKMFFSHVYKSGFELNIRKSIYNNAKEKYIPNGQDTELIIQALINKDKYDKLVLVSGKHDFLPLCEHLTLQGKEIEIIGFKNSIHKVYNKYKQRYIDILL